MNRPFRPALVWGNSQELHRPAKNGQETEDKGRKAAAKVQSYTDLRERNYRPAFGHVELPEIPGETRAFQVFVKLVDGIGKYSISVKIHDLREDEVLARADFEEIDLRIASAKCS